MLFFCARSSIRTSSDGCARRSSKKLTAGIACMQKLQGQFGFAATRATTNSLKWQRTVRRSRHRHRRRRLARAPSLSRHRGSYARRLFGEEISPASQTLAPGIGEGDWPFTRCAFACQRKRAERRSCASGSLCRAASLGEIAPVYMLLARHVTNAPLFACSNWAIWSIMAA